MLKGQPQACYLTKNGAHSLAWTAPGSTTCLAHVDTKGMVRLRGDDVTNEAKELRLLSQLWLRGSQGYNPHPSPPHIFFGFPIPDTKLESPFMPRVCGRDGKDEGKS